MISLPKRFLLISLLVVGFAVILYLVFFSPKAQIKTSLQVIPSPTPISINSQVSKTTVPINYVSGSADKIDKERQPLSASDSAAKQALLSTLGTNSSLLNITLTFRAEYIAGPDEILIEILTPDITQAKNDAVDWLSSIGFSHDGICHFPVVFFLNRDVAQQLQNRHISFKPLPEGC